MTIEPMWSPSTAIDPQEIKRLIGKSNPTILDIGCNDGAHTQLFFELFEFAHVSSFEPDWRAQDRFRNTTALTCPRARLFPVALGATDGTTEFYPSEGDGVLQPKIWDYSGSIRKPKMHLRRHPWCKFGPATTVPVMRLDSWARAWGITHVDFIWADVQGAEGDLIWGGTDTLARTRYFFTEYSDEEMYEQQPTLEHLLKLLPTFRIVHLYPEDVLLRNEALP